MDYPARERWRNLPSGVPREQYFRVLADAISEFYLADPSNPYQQSGRSSGAHRWEDTRRIFVEAIDRSGDFLDVGCANGLLLETLIAWAAEKGHAVRPYGIDFIPELIELARQRFPDQPGVFEVANAYYWKPQRQYDFVRTNLEYVPQGDWASFVRHQYAAVAPGGRFILAHYRNADEQKVIVADVIAEAGYVVHGQVEAPGVSVAWTDTNGA
jgi:SAM-dependent methyltransferase